MGANILEIGDRTTSLLHCNTHTCTFPKYETQSGELMYCTEPLAVAQINKSEKTRESYRIVPCLVIPSQAPEIQSAKISLVLKSP